MADSQRQDAESVAWFQRRIDALEADRNAALSRLAEVLAENNDLKDQLVRGLMAAHIDGPAKPAAHVQQRGRHSDG